MTTQLDTKDQFQKSLETFFRADDSLLEFRKKAWKAFEKRGLPGTKDEAFQYLKMGGLYQNTLENHKLEHPSQTLIDVAVQPFENENYLLFYNGRFLPRYSQFEEVEDTLVILPFTEAVQTYGIFLKNYFENALKKEQDPFALLSLALHQEGLFVYVPKNTHCEKELFIIEVSDAKASSFVAPLSLFSLGQNAALKVSTTTYNQDAPNLLACPYQGFILDRDAKVHHAHTSINTTGFRFESFRVQQKRESEFQHIQGTLDTFKIRSSYQVEQQEAHIRSEILALCALRGKEEAHIHILMEHQAPEGYSRQLVKNLVDEESQVSFEGKIKIESIAQQVNAYQLNHNTLLSDDANVYSKPNLEIFADDVKASHGSTTGQIDQEQLFYLRSRGLSAQTAKRILLRGFCDEIVEAMPSKILKGLLAQKLACYFEAS